MIMMGSLFDQNSFDERNVYGPMRNSNQNMMYVTPYQNYYQQPMQNIPYSHQYLQQQSYHAGYQPQYMMQDNNQMIGQFPAHVPQQIPYGPISYNNPFENPLQANQGNSYGPIKNNMQMAPNPYPKQNFMQKPQTAGFSSILNQFKTQEGSIDINKMMSTAGQMMNTMNQVQSMFKGFGSFFKT